MQAMFKQGLYNEKESGVSKKENKLPEFDPGNPQVYMDIEIGEPG